MKVVITDYEYPDIDAERRIILDAGHQLFDYQLKREDELAAAVRDADAVIVQYATISRRVIASLERCKMIIKYGIGVNNIDLAAATERGIYVCNVPDYGLDEVSSHACALLLALARKLPQASAALKGGSWGNALFRPIARLSGKTLGIVGFGALGRLVARKMSGFDLRIVAFDPFVGADEGRGLGIEMVSFQELCRRADFITVHCPLTKDTTHLFNREAFALMRDGVYFVNTSRGGVVDEPALLAALESGRLAGAGLDVFETEPLPPDSPLTDMANVIATGHVAWYSEQAITTLQRKVAEEVVNVLAGNPPFNPCNRLA